MPKINVILPLMLLVVCMWACDADPKYDRLVFTTSHSSPSGYETYIASDQITIPAGIVQPIKAEVEFKGDRYLIGSFINLNSNNESVFSVFSMENKNTFLLVGKKSGHTCMNVIVNGTWEECIEVKVP